VRSRIIMIGAGVSAAALVSSVAMLPATAGAAKSSTTAQATEYVVLLAQGADHAAAVTAVTKAGGTVVHENAAIGTLLVRSNKTDFARTADASAAIDGVARNRAIGFAPKLTRPSRATLEKLEVRQAAAERAARVKASAKRGHAPGAPAPEPLAGRQWDMQQIGATSTGSYARERGSRKVMVGVMDTGIDGSHPDIAPNFNARLSRNLTTDIPSIDGPCEVPSCVDPANVDDNEHGTHVASTIGSPINGLGMAGVAPNVQLVNIRAGQDSGFFFLAPTLDAFTYAGRVGIDVVNMSFFTDPWLFNCKANPADSPQEQMEQRTIIKATQLAADFARRHGVTLVAAEGNEATDLGHPTVDDTSPDFPEGTAKHRDIDNSCITVPTETRGVIAVSATGPSLRKSYYSNYGTEETDLAAPGGDVYDSPDHNRHVENAVLAAYPEHLAIETKVIAKHCDTPNTTAVILDRKGDTCAYYQYLQGTSMASPHAVGVAALAVSRFGHRDARHGGLTLAPAVTEQVLNRTATKVACPPGGVYTYIRNVPDTGTVTSTATCEGPLRKNGFYGRGIVSAFGVSVAHH
jgi:subtilisin family serine protease